MIRLINGLRKFCFPTSWISIAQLPYAEIPMLAHPLMLPINPGEGVMSTPGV